MKYLYLICGSIAFILGVVITFVIRDQGQKLSITIIGIGEIVLGLYQIYRGVRLSRAQ